MTLWMPNKKKPLYAPMLATFGGGSVRGFQGAGGGGLETYTWTSPNLSQATYGGDSHRFTQSQASTPTGLFFKWDGTSFYITDYNNDAIYQYDMTTAWDIGTASYANKSFSLSSQDNNPLSSYFKNDGTTFYVTGYGLNKNYIWQYTMSTPWDISTASYANKVFTGGGSSMDGAGLFLSSDGTKAFQSGYGYDYVEEYTLSTAWDISTASHNVSNDFNHVSNSSLTSNQYYEHYWNPDGTEFYLIRSGSSLFMKFSVSTAWDISTANYNSAQSLTWTDINQLSSNSASYAFYIKPDGSKLYQLSYQDISGTPDYDSYMWTLDL